MYEKIALLLSISVAVGGVVGPFITGFMNNRHQIKLIEIEHRHKLEVEEKFYRKTIFENYLIAAQKMGFNSLDKDIQEEYSHWYSLALIYFPDEFNNDLKVIDSTIRDAFRGSQDMSDINGIINNIRKYCRNDS